MIPNKKKLWSPLSLQQYFLIVRFTGYYTYTADILHQYPADGAVAQTPSWPERKTDGLVTMATLIP